MTIKASELRKLKVEIRGASKDNSNICYGNFEILTTQKEAQKLLKMTEQLTK